MGMETGNNTVTEPAAASAEKTSAPSAVKDTAMASAENTPAASTATQTQDPASQKAVTKAYDQAYIDKLLADQEAARKAAVEEALKVAKMDEASKAAYEKEKLSKELADREAQIALRELKADAVEVLDKNEVPREFLDMLVGKSMEETKTNVEAFKTTFDAAVQKQVEKRLAGTTPKGGNGSSTQSEAEAMSAEIDKYLV